MDRVLAVVPSERASAHSETRSLPCHRAARDHSVPSSLATKAPPHPASPRRKGAQRPSPSWRAPPRRSHLREVHVGDARKCPLYSTALPLRAPTSAGARLGAANKGAAMQPAGACCLPTVDCLKKRGPTPSRAPQHLTTQRVHALLGPKNMQIQFSCTCNEFKLLQRNAHVACLLSNQRGRPSHAMLGKTSKRKLRKKMGCSSAPCRQREIDDRWRQARPPRRTATSTQPCCEESGPAGKRRRTPQAHPGHHTGPPNGVKKTARCAARKG